MTPVSKAPAIRARGRVYVTLMELAGSGLLWPLAAVAASVIVVLVVVNWAVIWALIVGLLQLLVAAVVLGFVMLMVLWWLTG